MSSLLKPIWLEAADNNREIEEGLRELGNLGLQVNPETFATLRRSQQALEEIGDFFSVLEGYYNQHGARGPDDLTPEQSLELLQLIGGLSNKPPKN